MAKCRETFRKKITSPELLEQVNPANKKLVNRFLKNFATKRSPKSVVVYKSNLDIFFTWNLLENENKHFVEIRKLELMDFFDYCVTELQWSSNRFAQCHSSLSSFSAWVENMYDDVYPDFRNLFPKIEKPTKEAVRKKSVFTKEEIDHLMNCLSKRPQEQCLLALLISSGARASELSRFTTDLVDENNTVFEGLFLETTDTIKVKGRGVNGKSLIRYILKDTFLPYYQRWLPIREQIMKENGVRKHNHIFILTNGQPADTNCFRRWVQRWNRYCDKPLYLHSMRHYFTSECIRKGLEQEFIKEIIGWESIDMVNVYNDVSLSERKWKGLDKFKEAMENEKPIFVDNIDIVDKTDINKSEDNNKEIE